MKPTDLVDAKSLRDDVPDFVPGDTLKVHVRVVEGTRERVQIFQGAVIRRPAERPAVPAWQDKPLIGPTRRAGAVSILLSTPSDRVVEAGSQLTV